MKCLKYQIVFWVTLLSLEVKKIDCHVEMTNVKYISLDKSFSEFDYCYLKSVNRTYKFLSLKVILHKKPVTKVSMNLEILKRYNGYKPFLYNITFDACKFLASRNTFPVIKYFYRFIDSHSNMNHTCPYNHDLIVEKVSIEFINDLVTKVLPFPEGDYVLVTRWYAYGINRADVKLYFTIS